ncbi:MAG: gliding motility-associated C-terminal domain-containing protein [Chitinophagaceae bacterium]|nr:gliding motility-associated C-terminal domain-containing protein [Chitinophagaceae bacterium]
MVDSSLGIIADPSIPYTTVDAFVQSRYTCPDYIDSCSFMKITGPVSLCSLSDTYTYRMHRNRKCTLSPQWQLPAGVTIINQTDSTLSVQFSTFGVYRIYASMYSCIPVKDSLIVNMVSGSGTLNIGADTSICPGSTITLQANNFLSYLWNNGSTGSAITVTQPGTYWVETIDSCNNRLRDSIIIKAYDQLINIGPDRIKCNNDTLHLNAPGGFLNYTWSNNYNISSTTAQNVVVYPSVDTTYYLKAEKLPGCFAYDTVHISVNHSPLVNLGIDTSICIGTAIRFDAGPGFVQYQWNTGASTQQISVNNVGIFSVIATAQNGCKSFDTVRLVKINQLPVVSLNPDTTICYSDTRILDAGVGYVSYLWNTGSVQRSINVNGTGNFSVNVIDANGCKGSGSIYINTILPTPSGFLPPDTSICTYSKMVLKTAVPFNQYLWNDNSVASSITVSAPGLYWLQVMDNKNCKGKDTIIVMPKNCTRGLFVPGAFTPNGDFKNDLFKPTLFGTVQRYEFIVYNRYGETVFETKDIMKGWDGAYKGKQQNAGVYVWKCIYQVDSQMLTSEQGTIVLIR